DPALAAAQGGAAVRAAAFLTRRRGTDGRGLGWHWTDIATWAWLIGGVVLMFGPALWLVLSSFKTPAALAEFPPTILPYAQQVVEIDGRDRPLYTVTLPDGTAQTMAELRRVGIVAQMVDPAAPEA